MAAQERNRAREAQGEDHEAGIEANWRPAAQEYAEDIGRDLTSDELCAFRWAYLSRCPSPDIEAAIRWLRQGGRRSPDEPEWDDHQACGPSAADALERWRLSRCPSPERDPGVKAEVERLRNERDWIRRSAQEIARQRDEARERLRRLVELKDHPEHDNISPIVKREAWDAAREALAEFSDASKEER